MRAGPLGRLHSLGSSAGQAFVGLSRIRAMAVWGGLPLDDRRESLRCGVAVVDCGSGEVVASLSFRSGVDEIPAVTALPGYGDPALPRPHPDVDETETIWLAPSRA